MIRKTLLNTLELVRPALADENMVPIFTNYCFLEGKVYATKDDLSIVAPCDVEQTFAVHGKTLFDLLKNSSSNDVEFDLDKDHVLVKAGKSRIKLPYLEKDEYLFDEPEDESWDIILDVNDELLTAIELCLTTSTTDNSMPAFMGITIKGGKTTCFYSCDGDALSQYKFEDMQTVDDQYIVPRDFCEALLRIAEKTGFSVGQFYVNKEWALAELGNDFKIFGRIIEATEPFDFEGNLDRVIKKAPKFYDIPDSINPALNRARVVADPEGKPTTLKVEGGKLTLHTETQFGNVKDTVGVDKDHPDVEASVSAKLIQRAINICDGFSLFENCTVYRKEDNFLLLIANYE